MKNCRTLSFLLCCIVLFSIGAIAQIASAEALVGSGRVDGAVYKNSYLGVDYFIPENWAARVTPQKLPGANSGYLLLTLKRKGGEQLSSLTMSVTELSAYGGDLQRYLDTRYRAHDDNDGTSEVTINGITVNKTKREELDPQLMMVANRAFYRVDKKSGGITRVAVATEQRGYALVFELIVPTSQAGAAIPEFMDSLYAVTFPAAAAK